MGGSICTGIEESHNEVQTGQGVYNFKKSVSLLYDYIKIFRKPLMIMKNNSNFLKSQWILSK